MNIQQFVIDIESQKENYNISKLQLIRKEIHGMKKMPSKNIFSQRTTHDNYAFHNGGRSELQFNIGIEKIDNINCLRFGVAFSLEPSQSLPDVTILFPKIRKFNEFILLNSMAFNGYYTWCWSGSRSQISNSCIIDSNHVLNGNFIFFGKYSPIDEVDPHVILSTFDELLPLYEYVETNTFTSSHDQICKQNSEFQFKPRKFYGIDSTRYTHAEQVINVKLRHHKIMYQLVTSLAEKYGEDNVAAELSTGINNRVDVILKNKDEFWFYEIKTYLNARACIREALGQLLEYSYWPRSKEAAKLIVVAEAPLDQETKEYLHYLQNNKSIPIYYEQIFL